MTNIMPENSTNFFFTKFKVQGKDVRKKDVFFVCFFNKDINVFLVCLLCVLVKREKTTNWPRVE